MTFRLRQDVIGGRLNDLERKMARHFARCDAEIAALNDEIACLVRRDIPREQCVFYDGQLWDACFFVEKLIARARASILLIDSWVDIITLDMLSKKQKGVKVLLVTSTHKDRRGRPRSMLAEGDIAKFNAQYPTLTIVYSKQFHDRFLILDDSELYLIGASLKDLGKKCMAVTRLDARLIDELKAHC